MTKFTKKAEESFLAELRKGKPVIRAAERSGLSRVGIYKARDVDPEFATKWDEAIEDGRQTKLADVEEEMDRRGIKGAPDPIYHKGERVGWRHKYSDRLLLARAWALDPDRYGDRRSVDVDDNARTDIRAAPDYKHFRDTLLTALRPYPEAFQAVADAMASLVASTAPTGRDRS